LAKQDEISSTQRLLDLIRDEDETDFAAAGQRSHKSIGDRLKGIVHNPVFFRKTISVGVDLGHDDLKMVKIHRISDQKFEMLEYARIPFDPDIPRESPEFYQFLRPVLANFCANSKNVEIWCTISSARVETRHLRIPKVSHRLIPNSAYWSYQKESSFSDKEKQFDFELLGEVEDGGHTKIDIMAYTAPQAEIKNHRDIFIKAGFPLTGISIVPFAFQTLLRAGRIVASDTHVSCLYIGRDWSRIDIFSEGNLMLSRGIKAGVKTMIEALRTEIEGNLLELSITKSSAKDAARIQAIKKKLKFELDRAHQLFFGVIHDGSPPVMEERQRLLKEDKIFKMILPALERLVRQVERTLRHFSLNFENARVGKIFISSGVNPHQRIIDYISEELGIPTEVLNPFADSDNFISLTPSPEAVSEQSQYVPAMGMALASNALTPNFLYTHKDKQKAVKSQRVNRAVFAGFLLVTAICIGVSFFQSSALKAKQYRKVMLQQQLEKNTTMVDEGLILKLVDEIQKKNKQILEIGERYTAVAVISEIADLTPANVRLFSISARLNDIPGDKQAKKNRDLVLSGIVRGDRLTMESTLAGYLMDLNNSPLFGEPAIRKKSFERFEDQEVLSFTARLILL
jgi:type IV pilus assembly protein PilM